MSKTNNDTPIFYYPDYIVETIGRLMEASLSPRHPLLNKRVDILGIIFSQSNSFPITDQVYSMVWGLLNRMAEQGERDWLQQYWVYVTQHCMFKFSYSNSVDKDKFLEFHLMVGALMVYMERYDILSHMLSYTSTLPPAYPLVPSTFISIFNSYRELSKKNERFYLMKYRMRGMNAGAREESKVEGLLLDYSALLLIRLNKVNDYNITFSNPLDFPTVGNTVEEAIRNDNISGVLRMRIDKWSSKKEALRKVGLSTEDVNTARDLIDSYSQSCKTKQEKLKGQADISKEKQDWLKKDMLEALNNSALSLPMSASKQLEYFEVTPMLAHQNVFLDKNLILTGFDPISNNLGESLVGALYAEMRYVYCYQFLLHSAVASFAVPYRDFSKAMARLCLKDNHIILALGVSRHFLEETDGFICEGSHVSYGKTDVMEIPSNQNSILIMQKKDVPFVVFRSLSVSDFPVSDFSEIDVNHHLYSNIDNLTLKDTILHASIGYNLIIPKSFRYVRLKVAYQLDSDNLLLDRISNITNYIGYANS